jgi:predicted  nucleic acid-binding Zn-ribbon protein
MKNSDHEKTIDSINTRKHELEQEKVDIQRQMEKKDSEINDLNTKFNEKISEIQSLKSDNKVLGEQLVNKFEIKFVRFSILFIL